MKKNVIVVTVSILLLPLLALLNGCQTQRETGKVLIKIALAAPLTGDVASMGQGMKNAATLAIEEANIKYPQYEFQLLAIDDRADPKEAVNGASQIVSERGVYGVVGHLNSGCSIPASTIYARNNLVMITPASTNPKLTQEGKKNVFRVCATDEVQGSYAANEILKMGLKRVVIIHDKTPYGQGLAEEFKKTFEANHGQVLAFEGISVGDKDFKALLINLKTLLPEVIYYGGMYQEAGLLTKQAKGLGITVPLVGGDGIFSHDFITIAGAASEGDIASNPGLPLDKMPSAVNFVAAYQQRFPSALMQPYDFNTYDATNLLVKAVVDTAADRTQMISYLNNIDYLGITGQIKFDEKGDNLNKAISLNKVKDGKWQPW